MVAWVVPETRIDYLLHSVSSESAEHLVRMFDPHYLSRPSPAEATVALGRAKVGRDPSSRAADRADKRRGINAFPAAALPHVLHVELALEQTFLVVLIVHLTTSWFISSPAGPPIPQLSLIISP